MLDRGYLGGWHTTSSTKLLRNREAIVAGAGESTEDRGTLEGDSLFKRGNG